MMNEEERVTQPTEDIPGDARQGGKPVDTVGAKAAQGDVGTALRAAFRATVDEQVPDAMLDLLKRLS